MIMLKASNNGARHNSPMRQNTSSDQGEEQRDEAGGAEGRQQDCVESDVTQAERHSQDEVIRQEELNFFGYECYFGQLDR